jgi:predicted nucleic acid-binding protein
MIIVDTGFWIALINQKDKHHTRASLLLNKLIIDHETLITTCAVMTETCHLLVQRMGTHAQAQFMHSYQLHAFQVVEITSVHRHRMTELMQKYIDLPMDFADASLVILAEEIGDGRILSTDKRDFTTYRWKQNQPFQNLLMA